MNHDTTAPEEPDRGTAPSGAPVPRSRRLSLLRSSDERVVAGVASGLAARLRLPTAYVRAAAVVLTLAGGVGVVLYAAGWILGSATTPTTATRRDLDDRQGLGLGLVLVATLLVGRATGLWLGDAVVWPTGLVAFGVAAIWDRSAVGRTPAGTGTSDGPGRLRIIGGAILMLGGIAALLTRLDAVRDLGTLVLAVAASGAGFMLVFGPWVSRLAGELAAERRDRVRSEERAEVAAHLHDSVLQTLALIQRSNDRRRMVTLARSQERELRSWLYGSGPGGERTLAGALQTAAGRVEQTHDVPIEVVVVNDLPMTGPLEPLVAAATEAMHNAARHSGASRVAVYAEAGPTTVDVFVTDQGAGFDPDEVPPDRHGLRHSVVGRMARHGGEATVSSETGEGTEVHLAIPVDR